MAALSCEICGGKLMAKSGGIFECDSCGMQYDKTRIQEMVQEIKGTVKIEGTVEVQGTVKIDGPVKVEGGVNIESLLKRGQMALEDRDWMGADRFFDDALNLDAECVPAHLGKLMAELGVRKQEDLKNCRYPFDGRNSYQKVVRFADESLRITLQGYLATINKRNEQERIAQEKKQEDERIALKKKQEQHVKNWESLREKLLPLQNSISAGYAHSIGLYPDGTAIATKYTDKFYAGQCDVSCWRDVVAVSAGENHTVGLKADGTVVATGSNKSGRRNVGDWTNIIAIDAGQAHTVGLRADGSVLAVGNNKNGQCNVSDWRDIVAISAGEDFTVGLKFDGTVVATKYIEHPERNHGQCDVAGWTDIVAISAGGVHTVGLKADGSVVAKGANGYGQCDVSCWRDIVAISAGRLHTVGLKMDGTVVATSDLGIFDYGQSNVSGWQNIVAISAGLAHTVGLKADGTVVTAGANGASQCETAGWRLFNDWSNLKEEKATALKRREEEQAVELDRQRRRDAGRCQHCGGELKGVFGKKCVSCGKPKDY